MKDANNRLIEEGREIYNVAVNQVLAGYQLIEEMLKTYIETHFDLVRTYISDRVYFGFRRDDYQEAALGRLIQVFSKLCKNIDLVAELRSVVSRRDHIAHKALLKTYGSVSPEEYVQLHDEMLSHMRRISELMRKLSVEQKCINGLRDGDSVA